MDRLWAITEDLNILYRENWTELARHEMKLYQDRLVRTLRRQMTEERYSSKQTWTFSMSFLYAVTLVTTIGTCEKNQTIEHETYQVDTEMTKKS